MDKNILKFILFCIGLSVATATSSLFLLVLCLNLNTVNVVTFEHNPFFASFEVGLLIIAIATCVVASEIYYKYLKMQTS
jgi:hypothetical protein